MTFEEILRKHGFVQVWEEGDNLYVLLPSLFNKATTSIPESYFYA